MNTRKPYTPPQVRHLGSVADLTKTFAEGGWAGLRKPRDTSSHGRECSDCGSGFDKLS